MESKKRIALISEHASPFACLGGADAGGQNVYVDQVSRHLAQQGYEIDIFSRRDDPMMPEICDWSPGVRVMHLEAGPVCQLPKDDIWPYMPAFREAFTRFMVRDEKCYDLLHGHFWMSGWVASELRRLLSIPAVQLFHATGITKQRYQGQADTSPAERIQVEKSVIQQVDKVIAQCPSEWQELVDEYGAAPSKLALIPAAANTTLFRPVARTLARKEIGLRQLGISESAFTIAYVGRLLPRKDVRNIVQALAILLQEYEERLPVPVKLLVVGGETLAADPLTTPEIGELQNLASELGIQEHVHFFGKRQPDMLRYYYSAADVVVTTPWYEPFGLTPLEGMACGRPVIGSAVGGITYTIRDGETGFLVPPRVPGALAERLYTLMQRPELCQEMGWAARKRVEREFTWSRTASRLSQLYEELIYTPPVLPIHTNTLTWELYP